MTGSVRPSVCLSVCPSVTPFVPCSHHRIIMKFSGVITNDKSDVHAKGQGQRSKVKVTEVTTQLNRFRTVTPVWIHIWWWNDAYSLMKEGRLRRAARQPVLSVWVSFVWPVLEQFYHPEFPRNCYGLLPYGMDYDGLTINPGRCLCALSQWF